MGPAVCVQAKVNARPEGSELALPSSVTKAPEATAWSGPASAVGAAGGGGGGWGLTVMLTVEGAEVPVASLTTSEKVRIAAGWSNCTIGAVKNGFDAVALESVTSGPAVCVHWKERAIPVASALALPSSVIAAPEETVWAAPALATGGAGGGGGGGWTAPAASMLLARMLPSAGSDPSSSSAW